MRVVVVGGGISGLAAAWGAQATLPEGSEVLVLERDAAVGGKARTFRHGDWLLEGGPGGYIPGRHELNRLIAASGMETHRVTAGVSARRRFLYRGGRLRNVPTNPLAFASSGILSLPGLLRLAAEPLVAARPASAPEETVWQFAERRLGRQAAERLIAPMTLGIFAGDARRLSLPAAFPRMARLEQEHGSLIRGLIRRRGHTSAGPLTSFADGMQSLPRGLAEHGGFTVRTAAEVRALQRDGEQWRVAVVGDAEAIPADAVIVAAEAWAAAKLMGAHDTELARDLAGITCPPVAVLGLGYTETDLARLPNGFGALVARGEGLRMLGSTWDSHLYPGRSPRGHTLLRVMYGGGADPEAALLSDEKLLSLARSDLARLVGITAAPRYVDLVRWARAIPQYELGHAERVLRIERAVDRLPGLYLTGNALRGVAFADAAADGVRTGELAGRDLAAPLALPVR